MTFAGDAGARMPRVTFANISTGESIELPFVPAELNEEISVEYARQKVVGMSHSILQYSGTENHKFSGLEFAFVGTPVDEIIPTRQDISLDQRKFLMSLCYPSIAAQGVRTGGPPRVLFIWPQLVSMTCKLANLKIKHSKFDTRGRPMVFTATMDLEEIRDVRLTSEDVRFSGTQRSNGQPIEALEI